MKNLFKKLAAFQQEVPVIHKGTQGYGYSYANLSTIFEVINPLLKKHSLGFTQLIGDNNIKTIIFEVESGETLETITTIPQGTNLKGMNDFQTLGSAVTYIRRYSLSSALGLITDKDTDAGEPKEQPKQTPIQQPTVDEVNAKIINAKNLEELKSMFLALPVNEQKLAEKLKEELKAVLK